MKIKISIIMIIIFVILMLSNYSKINNLNNEIQNLQNENENLVKEVSELKKTKNNLFESLNKEQIKNKKLSNALERAQRDSFYLDTLVEGKETFTTYENLIKNFGNPKEIRNLTNEDNIYIHGCFAVLVYDDIEFVVNCSGNEDDIFFIKNNDYVCRVDITGDNYILDRAYFNGIKIGDSAQEIANHYDKKIYEINYMNNEDYDLGHMNIVIRALRNDYENYKFKKGIYFSGNMPSGLALGIVLLIDDNNKVARIIMGWPTAG